MLCVAKVNLSDWPEGHRREIDPTNERNVGLLRAGYIVPLQLPRRLEPEYSGASPRAEAQPPPPTLTDPESEAAAPVKRPAAKRRRRPRTGDE